LYTHFEIIISFYLEDTIIIFYYKMAKGMPPLTLKFDPKMNKFSEPFCNNLNEIIPRHKISKICSIKAKKRRGKTNLISK